MIEVISGKLEMKQNIKTYLHFLTTFLSSISVPVLRLVFVFLCVSLYVSECIFILNVTNCRGLSIADISRSKINILSSGFSSELLRQWKHEKRINRFLTNGGFSCSFINHFPLTSLLSSNARDMRFIKTCRENSKPSKTEEIKRNSTLNIDLSNKIAFVAGVADSNGYGWAIAKQLAAAGATITVGTWPPLLSIFKKLLTSGRLDDNMKLPNGSMMEINSIYPLDASLDTPNDVPEEIKNNPRYKEAGQYTISEVAEAIKKNYGKIDILVHSLANAPEIKKTLLETSRKGYLSANSASAFSFVSLVQNFAPIMNNNGAVLSLSYIASDKVIPGYGGGMSSAKASLESDTRTLAWEVGRKYGLRVNVISAGPLKSRAASAIGGDNGKTFIEYAIDYSLANSPLQRPLYAEDVANTALFLLSPMSSGITGQIIYVDNGLNIMGQAVNSNSFMKN